MVDRLVPLMHRYGSVGEAYNETCRRLLLLLYGCI